VQAPTKYELLINLKTAKALGLVVKQTVAAVYEALARRHPKSRSRGRLGAPAEMVLRLLILKHIRNWSYVVLEREVRANLVYRRTRKRSADCATSGTPHAALRCVYGVRTEKDQSGQLPARTARAPTLCHVAQRRGQSAQACFQRCFSAPRGSSQSVRGL
jgi:hypothetical protein